MKISVIIPVYNTESYLDRCIYSVLNQDMKDLEIILVDDGSKDSSPELCDKYAEKYPFIQALHIENSGPATAKNKGYACATGEYISFIDSDDELMPHMYSTLLKSAEAHNADIVCCSYIQINEAGVYSHEESSGKEYVFNQMEGLKHLLDKNMIYSQCWTKIYKKETLDKFHISFMDGLKTEEDFIYNLRAFAVSKIITITDQPLYIYTHREQSLSREYHKSNLDKFQKNMTYRLNLTNALIKERYPQLLPSCIVHSIAYYNLLIGRMALFNYEECQPYYRDAVSYIKKHPIMLLQNHSRCGFSLLGAFALLLLPARLYFSYRKRK